MARAEATGRKKRTDLQAKTKKALASTSSVSPAVYSIASFCVAHSISVDFYFRLQRDGIGPKVMRIGGRTLISYEAAADWRKEREEASVAAE